jgi:hypothetical protein
MMTNTVYDVIDTGVHYLVNMYDSWKVEDMAQIVVYSVLNQPHVDCL